MMNTKFYMFEKSWKLLQQRYLYIIPSIYIRLTMLWSAKEDLILLQTFYTQSIRTLAEIDFKPPDLAKLH